MKMNSQKIVIDTNIIISAVLMPASRPRQALDLARKSSLILMSQSVWLELSSVFHRPKFNKYITPQERNDFLEELEQQVIFIEITDSINECRDAKDNKYLELAVSGQAQYILTGDKDLLVLHPFLNIAIITVDNFLNISKKLNGC